jgi:hypothetical protein
MSASSKWETLEILDTTQGVHLGKEPLPVPL